MTPPSIDDACGRHFRFRKFFECSDTWDQTSKAMPFENIPLQLASFDAIRTLCQKVLDPLYEYVCTLDGFSGLKLTYAFVADELDKRVRERNTYPNTTDIQTNTQDANSAGMASPSATASGKQSI
jgi:hypothetical protein